MNSSVQEGLESIVKEFEKRLKSVTASNYKTPQFFANHCTDLLNKHLSKLTQYVIDNSTNGTFNENYFDSFQYYRQCSDLLQTYVSENL